MARAVRRCRTHRAGSAGKAKSQRQQEPVYLPAMYPERLGEARSKTGVRSLQHPHAQIRGPMIGTQENDLHSSPAIVRATRKIRNCRRNDAPARRESDRLEMVRGPLNCVAHRFLSWNQPPVSHLISTPLLSVVGCPLALVPRSSFIPVMHVIGKWSDRMQKGVARACQTASGAEPKKCNI